MEILGYQVEKVEQPGEVGYILHGKKVDYKLLRYQNMPHRLYAVNSHGNICGIKGNYTFTDKLGTLKCWYPSMIGE